ncbi:DNRLRE domain-containing protein [Candidatus Woesearchaeota archaeon]|nr:DNRLRE domain-containing protein [Candidatus Woesearchaeota archaeon]
MYDTYVTEDSPNTNYGTSTDIRVDGAGPHGHALIAFPSIFGPGSNQIPFGAQIDLATLTVNCWNSGNTMNAYLLLQNWTQTGATWNSRDGTSSWTNPGADGAGSRDSTATAWTCMPTGMYHYTMTQFISKWSNGTANYRIALIDTGEDGNGFNSHEDPVVFEKPQLNVTFTVYT